MVCRTGLRKHPTGREQDLSYLELGAAQPPIHKSNNENTTNKHNHKVSEHAICERTAQRRSGEHLNERAQYAGKRVPSFATLLPLLLLPLLLPLVCCCVLPPVDGPCSKKSCSTQNPVGVMATSGEDAGSHRQHLLPSEPPPPQHGANVIYRLSSKQVTKEEEEEQEKEEEDSRAKYLPLTQKDVANGVMGEKDAVEAPTLLAQATAALSYAVASLMVIFVNKVGEYRRRTQIHKTAMEYNNPLWGPMRFPDCTKKLK